MKTVKMSLCVAMAMPVSVVVLARADYDVLLKFDGDSATERYTVSSDGKNWTKTANFIKTTVLQNFAAPGDGYIYAEDGCTIKRYDASDVRK